MEGRGKAVNSTRTSTYRITSLRGLSDNTGNKAKARTKQASAPRLQAAKINMRSHRLTIGHELALLL